MMILMAVLVVVVIGFIVMVDNANVVNNLRRDRANMVLMHDIKGYSVDSVEDIIIYGLANGYTFLPITQKTVNIHQNVNN